VRTDADVTRTVTASADEPPGERAPQSSPGQLDEPARGRQSGDRSRHSFALTWLAGGARSGRVHPGRAPRRCVPVWAHMGSRDTGGGNTLNYLLLLTFCWPPDADSAVSCRRRARRGVQCLASGMRPGSQIPRGGGRGRVRRHPSKSESDQPESCKGLRIPANIEAPGDGTSVPCAADGG
jgi:hypothetical protein